MIDLPPLLTEADLRDRAAAAGSVVVARAAAQALVPALSDVPRVDTVDQIPATARCVIVIGGGMRIDAVKAWRAQQAPQAEVLAIATRFGSGAEANRIAVLDDQGAKTVLIDDACLPDARYYAPAALDTLDEDAIAWGVGDTLTHALEGMLSPLASDALRADLADVLRRALELGPGRDPEWFELSALASAGQAQSSVGLAHGLAHALEPVLVARLDGRLGGRDVMGHARLCSAFLAPVLRFNLALSDKAAARLDAQGLEAGALLALAEPLSRRALDLDLPWAEIIRENWLPVLRDPCSRTNVTTVRKGSVEPFLEQLAAGAAA